MARDYELGVIINPDVGDDQARAIVDRVTQTITANDGQVVRVNAWGRRRLAYPIERHRDGLFFFYDLTLQPDSTAEIERSIRVNEDILRHLLKLRDPRVVAQQRQRDVEADALAAQQAEEAARQAEQAAAEQAAAEQVAEPAAPAGEAPTPAEAGAEAPTASETAAPEADTPDTPAPAGATASATTGE